MNKEGIYTRDLTASEMDADVVTLIPSDNWIKEFTDMSNDKVKRIILNSSK